MYGKTDGRAENWTPIFHLLKQVRQKSIITKVNVTLFLRTGFGTGCVQFWIRSAEPPGEHRYENRSNNIYTYSRILMARTLMARLPRLF